MSRMTQLAAMAAMAWGAVAAPASAQEGATPSMLRVDNERAVPVVVYLEQGAYDSRLGTVPAHQIKDLHIPIAMQDGDKIFFTIHPEFGMDLQTPDGLRVTRGEMLTLVVPISDVGFVPVPPAETIPAPSIKGPTVTVDNSSSRAAVVFLEHGEFDQRIGTVAPHEEKTLPIPSSLTEQDGRGVVDIFVHQEGGEDLASHRFELAPDAHLEIDVPR